MHRTHRPDVYEGVRGGSPRLGESQGEGTVGLPRSGVSDGWDCAFLRGWGQLFWFTGSLMFITLIIINHSNKDCSFSWQVGGSAPGSCPRPPNRARRRLPVVPSGASIGP